MREASAGASLVCLHRRRRPHKRESEHPFTRAVERAFQGFYPLPHGWPRRLETSAMLIRHVVRWLSYLGVAGASALTVVACGGGQKGESAGSMGGATGAGGGGGSDAGISLLDGGGCQPATCASAGYTCGMNGDGCGNT